MSTIFGQIEDAIAAVEAHRRAHLTQHYPGCFEPAQAVRREAALRVSDLVTELMRRGHDATKARELRNHLRSGDSSASIGPSWQVLRAQLEDVAEREQIGQGQRAEVPGKDFVFSRDYRSCSWRGKLIIFTPTQAPVMRALDESYDAGTPVLGEARLIEESGSASENGRLRDLFRGHEAWGTLVIQAGKGAYRLASPSD